MNCMGSSMGPQEDEGVLRGCTLLKISEISSWESLGRNRHCSGKNWDNVEKEGLESRNRWFQRKQNPALKERAYLWEANSQSIYALVPLTLRYLAHIFVCNNLKTKLSYVTEKQEICTGKFVDISDCLQVFFQLCCVFTFFKALRWNSLWSLVSSLFRDLWILSVIGSYFIATWTFTLRWLNRLSFWTSLSLQSRLYKFSCVS